LQVRFTLYILFTMEKVYLEITNICNLSCSFCHGTKRPPRQMTMEEFEVLTNKLLGKAKHLYFHLMGEPLLHPLLPRFIEISKEKGFIPIITTNGTLLDISGEAIIKAKPFKISISLQSYEGNGAQSDDKLKTYLNQVCSFAKKASPQIVVVLRLWNKGGLEAENSNIEAFLHEYFPGDWRKNRSGFALSDKIFLEYGESFSWPDQKCEEKEGEYFCYGLRNQIGVLADGTVVPCCLDADGEISLGNLFFEDFDEVLQKPRAKAIYDGFSMHKPLEELCRRCGYAADTKRYHGTKNSPNR